MHALSAIETDNNTRKRRHLIVVLRDLGGAYRARVVASLFWGLAKVIAEQHAHRNRYTVAHGGEEVHLSNCIDN
jgi:hypothetical protein